MKIKIRLYLFVFWILSILSLFAGCATGKKPSGMTYKKAGITVTVTNTENIKTPAVVKISETGAVDFTSSLDFTPIEKAEAVKIEKEAETKAVNSIADATANNAGKVETAKAIAKAVLWFHLAAGALLLIGGVLAYIGHSKAAVIAFCGSPALLMLGSFASNGAALMVCGLVFGLIAALVGAWYLMKRKIPDYSLPTK